MNIYTHRTEFWSQLDDVEIRERLDELSHITVVLENDKTHAVAQARKLNLSWDQIARELNVTRQAAWEKWHHLDGIFDKPSLSPELTDAAMRQVLDGD
jgi:hypothetical protein